MNQTEIKNIQRDLGQAWDDDNEDQAMSLIKQKAHDSSQINGIMTRTEYLQRIQQDVRDLADHLDVTKARTLGDLIPCDNLAGDADLLAEVVKDGSPIWDATSGESLAPSDVIDLINDGK